MAQSETVVDLPLVSKEIRSTFDVVERATGKPLRITLLATVGVPYDENDAAESDGVFEVDDFDGRSTLEYLRLGDGLYALRTSLDRWQKPFMGLARELEELQGASENFYLMPRTSLHGVTGAKVSKWTTDAKGRVGDPRLDRIYDMSAIPARLEELRRVLARNVVLTSQGLAYRHPYPSWNVLDKGDVVALTRHTRSMDVHAFGLDRLDDAMEVARRLGGEPQVRGRVVQAPADPGPDVSARDAALVLAEAIREQLAPRLADLAGGDVFRWHDCANAEAILDAGGGEGVSRVLMAARALAHGPQEGSGRMACWRWTALAETRVGLELGERPAPANAPRP